MSFVDEFRRKGDQLLIDTAKSDIKAQELALAQHERNGETEEASAVRARIDALKGEIAKLEAGLKKG